MISIALRPTLFIIALALVACEDKGSSTDDPAAGAEGSATEADAAAAPSAGTAEDAPPKKTSDRAARREAKKAAEASLAESDFEAKVLANDVEGIRGMWVTAAEAEGCVTTKPGAKPTERVLSEEAWSAKLTENLESLAEELETIAGFKHGETLEHTYVVYRNEDMNLLFGGDDCAVDFHGKIGFNALLEEHPEGWDGVRYRAHLAQIGDTWKLYDISGPDTIQCDKRPDQSSSLCKKLRGEE